MHRELPVSSCSAGATATQIYRLPPCSNLTRIQRVFENITKFINVIHVRIQHGNMAIENEVEIWLTMEISS